MRALNQWRSAIAAIVMGIGLMASPVHAKVEPVRIGHAGQLDIAAQATPQPGEQAPGPTRDDAVLDRGDSSLSWVVAIAILLGAIGIAAWWWPKFQRDRNSNNPPITPSRGPAQNDRSPSDRGH